MQRINFVTKARVYNTCSSLISQGNKLRITLVSRRTPLRMFIIDMIHVHITCWVCRSLTPATHSNMTYHSTLLLWNVPWYRNVLVICHYIHHIHINREKMLFSCNYQWIESKRFRKNVLNIYSLYYVVSWHSGRH